MSIRHPHDVPSPIDLRDPAAAAAWAADAVVQRPSRPRFFEAFAGALNRRFDRPFSVVELGSGPGHLATTILRRCQTTGYTPGAFSNAMHQLARAHLGPETKEVQFVTADFRDDWATGLDRADAVITMQAAHEVRHKQHQPALLSSARDMLMPGGVFLFCDHYWIAGGTKHPDLYYDRAAQPRLLESVGFATVDLVHEEDGMSLYACCG